MTHDIIPQISKPLTDSQIDAMSILVLSFVGDSVQTLYERTEAATCHDLKAGKLHKLVAEQINAVRQARAVLAVEGSFSERESELFRRARNVSPRSLPKHSTQEQYRQATGFEAVLGYLYLTGQNERLADILSTAYGRQQR